MPPGGRGGGDPPASGRHRDGDEDTPPQFPAVALKVYQRRQLKEQQAAAKGTKQDHPPPTGRRCRDEGTKHLQVYQRRKKLRQLKEQQAAASIPEGPLIEILSRVPYSSLCRFKCVSTSWFALCSDPKIRKWSPQTLSGFFHDHIYGGNLKFRNLSGRGPPMVDPALPFLRGSYERFTVEQCCGGLLLCKCWESDADGDDYDLVVCNPATDKWNVLPPILSFDDEDDDEPVYFQPEDAFLAFDTAIHSRFAVLVPLRGRLDDVVIYLSETGRWMRCGSEDEDVPVVTKECVFLNGCMHFRIDEPCIVAFDIERNDWNRIPLPEETEDIEPRYGDTSMGQSQGLLHAWYTDVEDDYELIKVWVLKDYESGEWTLKHTIDVSELFDTEPEGKFGEMFAIHPERNLIFITDGEDTTYSYDMDNQEVNVMCTSGEFRQGGLPYIPCFADWLSSDGQ